MANRETIINEYRRISKNSALRRKMLLIRGQRLNKMKKSLIIISGILALLSAFIITSLLIRLFGNTNFQIFAALAAFSSGIIQLILTNNRDEEINEIFKGSSNFLILQDKCYRLPLTPDISDKKLVEQLTEVTNEYATLDSKYSKYFKEVTNNEIPQSINLSTAINDLSKHRTEYDEKSNFSANKDRVSREKEGLGQNSYQSYMQGQFEQLHEQQRRQEMQQQQHEDEQWEQLKNLPQQQRPPQILL